MTIFRSRRRKLGVLPLSAATFFMVSGGPYGLEEIVQKTGYLGAIVILMVVPLIWALPTGLMVGELATALPEEGGFYIWVRRAMGPFWGFQEAWLSLAASVFDMAAYPAVFVLSLGQLWPPALQTPTRILISASVILVGLVWNLFGCGGRGGRIDGTRSSAPPSVRRASGFFDSSCARWNVVRRQSLHPSTGLAGSS